MVEYEYWEGKEEGVGTREARGRGGKEKGRGGRKGRVKRREEKGHALVIFFEICLVLTRFCWS